MENHTEISVSKKKIKAGPGDQFRKLLKKISSLEEDAIQQNKELNALLGFYQQEISPLIVKRKDVVDQWIQLLMPFYASTQLKEKDRLLFTEIIRSQLMEYTFLSDGKMPKHLEEYFLLVEGKTFEEAKNEELRDSLGDIQGRFSEMGIDIDLSEINSNDSEEEIMRKMAEKISGEFEKREPSENKTGKKNKRLEEKERKEKIAEDLRKKNLNSVYRELAKAIHPDLEQDPGMKKVKEEVMKELTNAYEKQDLRTLFRLEIEWLQKEESHLENKPDELLKVYIKLLKDQIEDLKMQIEMEEMNPRYMILRKFFTPGFPLLEIDMQDWLDEEESMLANYQTNVESLKNYRPPVLPKMLRELISEFRLQKSRETFW